MSPKQVTAMVAALVVLVAINGVMMFQVLVSGDKNEIMHDQLIIAQAERDAIKESYNSLLERVGGADVPKLPKRPTGNTGDK